MKINDQPPIQPAPLGPAERPNARTRGVAGQTNLDDVGAAGRTGAPATRITISERSRELHRALAVANSAPDVRADVVAEMRARIGNGSYRIDPDQIARGLLDTTA